jgi:hypothetical protein
MFVYYKETVRYSHNYLIYLREESLCRSQWPRGLWHELSSPARTLGLWVRNTLKAWMYVFILCLYMWQPSDGLISRPRSPAECLRIKKMKWNEAFHGCHMLQSGSNRKRERERERERRKSIFLGSLFGLWTGRQRDRSSSLGRGNIFPLHVVQTGTGPTQPPIQWILGTLSSGVKRAGSEGDHPPPTSDEIKNMWIYKFIPPYAFMAWCFIN